MKMLLFEDPQKHDAPVFEVFQESLQRSGHTAVSVEDAASANIQLGDYGPFDYVLIHHSTPLEVRLLRRLHYQPPRYIGFSNMLLPESEVTPRSDYARVREVMAAEYDLLLPAGSGVEKLLELMSKDRLRIP